MIKDRWVFDDAHQTDILHRNEELNSLSRLLKPVTAGGRADDILIHGPSGVGKTATSRWMLRDLRKRAGVSSALVECSGQMTNGIIHDAIEKHPENNRPAEPAI